MANMFALILVIATLVTGILWCVDKFFFAPKRRERQAAAQAGGRGPPGISPRLPVTHWIKQR